MPTTSSSPRRPPRKRRASRPRPAAPAAPPTEAPDGFSVADGAIVGALPPPGPVVARPGDPAHILTRGGVTAAGSITGELHTLPAAEPLHAWQPVVLTGSGQAVAGWRTETALLGVVIPPDVLAAGRPPRDHDFYVSIAAFLYDTAPED